jgi:arsenate reductase
MAAAFFNAFTDPAKAHAVSAGTNPADHVHPQVVQVMRELGIDISNTRPRRLTSELAAPAHLLVTMGCGEQCPAVSALRHTDWDLEDPSGRSIERVRAIRDEIRRLVEGLIETNGWRRDRTHG